MECPFFSYKLHSLVDPLFLFNKIPYRFHRAQHEEKLQKIFSLQFSCGLPLNVPRVIQNRSRRNLGSTPYHVG